MLKIGRTRVSPNYFLDVLTIYFTVHFINCRNRIQAYSVAPLNCFSARWSCSLSIFFEQKGFCELLCAMFDSPLSSSKSRFPSKLISWKCLHYHLVDELNFSPCTLIFLCCLTDHQLSAQILHAALSQLHYNF